MGGSLGGMMMRVANSMGMGLHSSRGYSEPKPESWAEQVDSETEGALKSIQLEHERKRRWAILQFAKALEENRRQFVDAGLILPTDHTYMQIICRAHGIPFRKRKTRKQRYGTS